jgi:cysteine desulfurase/selenocysteine lyase
MKTIIKQKNKDNEIGQVIKKDFPILSQNRKGKKIVYLDSTATTQKPSVVIEAEKKYYTTTNANVHRGLYTLAENATVEYENARAKVASFIHVRSEEVVFTSGTTASINMIARMLENKVQAGDEIVVTIMEHHSNFLPWQQLAKRRKAVLKIIPITKEYVLDMNAARTIITSKTKIMACTYVSNVLGTINPVKELVAMAKKVGAVSVVDAAQAVPHLSIDVRALDCDFMAFSGHKMLAPTGIGVLYGKRELLDSLEPVMFGGEMVKEATLQTISWNDIPWKFEAGTPNIAGVIALGRAIDYLNSLDAQKVHAQVNMLTEYALQELKKISSVKIIGASANKVERAPVISFTMDKAHPHDIAEICNKFGVCIRAGYHCAMPLHTTLALSATARVSFYIYNTKEDVNVLIRALRKVEEVFA